MLTPYLRQGLERGEKVIYIVDAHTAETILGYLRNEGLQMEQFLKSGQVNTLLERLGQPKKYDIPDHVKEKGGNQDKEENREA